MKGAKGVLINITGGPDMTLFEVDEAANRIRDEVDPDANIIFGSTFDRTLEGTIRVSVVATGIDAEAHRAQARAPRAQPDRRAPGAPRAADRAGSGTPAERPSPPRRTPADGGYRAARPPCRRAPRPGRRSRRMPAAAPAGMADAPSRRADANRRREAPVPRPAPSRATTGCPPRRRCRPADGAVDQAPACAGSRCRAAAGAGGAGREPKLRAASRGRRVTWRPRRHGRAPQPPMHRRVPRAAELAPEHAPVEAADQRVAQPWRPADRLEP